MNWTKRTACLIGLAVALLGQQASAGGLTDVFSNQLAGLEMEPIGDALADTVASTYPVASASSSVTYTYNPELEVLERRTSVLGPILGERAETIGKNEINLEMTYSYVRLTTINGRDLDQLTNQASINGRVVAFEFPPGEGTELADGRFTTFLPIAVRADIQPEAHIITPTATYGVTPNLDLNLAIPLIRSSLDVTANTVTPDPRLPSFALAPGNPNAGMDTRTTSDSSFGIGDILLRAKYVFYRGRELPISVAGGLGLALPTGDEDDLQGTGDTRVMPSLVASARFFGDRVEPLVNLGFDIKANDVERSIFRWAVGASVQIFGPLTGSLVFLGANEFSEQTDRIETPFFFQIERNDIYDVAIGLRYIFWGNAVVSVNALVPLNDDGLRPDVIPTAQLQYVFSGP